MQKNAIKIRTGIFDNQPVQDITFNLIKDFTSHLSKFENISYLFGHIFKKEFSQNMGNVGLTILK